MADVMIGQDLKGFSGDMEQMETAIIKLQKNLTWILEHLDSTNVKTLNTNRTEIKSEDGATQIDGAQLVMKDKNGRQRVLIGKGKNGEFRFQLLNKNGRETMTLKEDGSAIFQGDIQGATIRGSSIESTSIRASSIEGANIRIAPNSYRDYIALENDGVRDTIGLYYGGTRIGGLRMLDAGAMEIFGSKISIGSSTGTVSIASGDSGTFLTADEKTVTVEKGVITEIA